MEAPTYEIKNVGDFLKIPEDRLDDCLKEFPRYLDILRVVVSMANTLSSITGKDEGVKDTAFIWVDDGKEEATIRIVANTPN